MEQPIEQLMASMTPATNTPSDIVAPIFIPYEEVSR